MTKVVIMPIIDGKRPSIISAKIKPSYEGAANKDGSWKVEWNPFIQGGVRRDGVGNYVVIHNLNTRNYSVSAGLLGLDASYEISEVGEVSFRLTIKKDNEPVDSDFRFCISVL